MGSFISRKKEDKDEKSDSETQKGVEAENKQNEEDKNENPEINHSGEAEAVSEEKKTEEIEEGVKEENETQTDVGAERTKNSTSFIVEPGYFTGHTCTMNPEKRSQYQIKCGAFKKFIMYWTCPRSWDMRAMYMFRSYASLCAEVQRQAMHTFVIHPFSRLRLGLEIFVILNYHFCITAITVCACEDKENPALEFSIFGAQYVYILFILANFCTGYVTGDTSQHVVLNIKKIVWRYFTSWFIIDLLYCFGLHILYFQLLKVFHDNISLVTDILIFSVKILRLPTVLSYSTNVMNRFEASERIKTFMHIVIVIYNYIVWNVFFQISTDYITTAPATFSNLTVATRWAYVINRAVTDNVTNIYQPLKNCSWMTISGFWNLTFAARQVYVINRAVAMLRRSSSLQVTEEGACDKTFYVVAWIIGWLVWIHCLAKYTILMIGEESAKAKFLIMMQQVEHFMNQRRYPDRIRKKILHFYAVRFQSFFISEKKMMSCMSGQLREDIIIHLSRQLVSKVEFLKKLPRSLLLTIGAKLKMQLFLSGDIIFKINEVADCLYFIDKGTVAVYCESGMEICHLQDGDYFGEIALVLPHQRFRVTSVVAITNCELFRLDKKDFDETIACYPTVYEEIKKGASYRWEHLIVIDEHHKAEMRGHDYEQEDENF